MKFWWQFTVDPEKHRSFVEGLDAYSRGIMSPGTEVTFHGMEAEFGRGLSQSDILSPPIYLRTVVPLFLDNALRAEREGYDAFVIGTFAPPVLPELRVLCSIPIVSAIQRAC